MRLFKCYQNLSFGLAACLFLMIQTSLTAKQRPPVISEEEIQKLVDQAGWLYFHIGGPKILHMPFFNMIMNICVKTCSCRFCGTKREGRSD